MHTSQGTNYNPLNNKQKKSFSLDTSFPLSKSKTINKSMIQG